MVIGTEAGMEDTYPSLEEFKAFQYNIQEEEEAVNPVEREACRGRGGA